MDTTEHLPDVKVKLADERATRVQTEIDHLNKQLAELKKKNSFQKVAEWLKTPVSLTQYCKVHAI